MIIGEVAQAHDGSLGFAHAFIDAIANAGADAVKFQTHIAAAESTPAEPWRVKFSHQDVSRYEYWKRMEFSEAQWRGLKQHAEERGLLFLSSPFSVEAVTLLKRIGIAAWKVASGEIGSSLIIEGIEATGLPIMLSTGMSSLDEVDRVVERIQSKEIPLTLFQCTTAYPCPPEKVGLNLLSFFRERYRCKVGLSDHTGTIFSGLAAATIGIDALEVHVTLSREMFGVDVPASVTTQELRQLVEGVRFIEIMNANPVDKNEMARGMGELRTMFTKSIVLADDLPAGTLLRLDHLQFKKPGAGIAPERAGEFVGRRLARDVKRDELLMIEDVEGRE